MKKIVFLFFASALFCFVNTTFANSKQDIRDRFNLYVDSWRNYDIETAYKMLTPYSREKLQFSAFEKTVLEFDFKDRTDEIKVVRLRKDGKSAIVAYRVEIKKSTGIVSGMLTSTWKFINNDWYRAYIEDREVDRKVVSNSPENIEFKLEEYHYNWDISDSLLSSKKLYRPEVRFRIKNTGAQPIESLQFKVQFLEKGKGIFSTESEYAISSLDIPLKEGELSETFFMKSSIGLDVNSLPLNDIYLKGVKKVTDNIYPVIYYKSTFDSEWEKYSIE